MIARVAPLVRLPRSLGWFDYRLEPGTLAAAGSLVRVPWRRRPTLGVVIETAKRSVVSDERLLSVSACLTNEPLLSGTHLTLARVVADESFTSVATTLRAVLPPLPKTLKPLTLPPTDGGQLPRLTALDSILGSSDPASLIRYSRSTARDDFVESSVRAVLAGDRTVLVITPTIERAEALAARLPYAVAYHRTDQTLNFRNRYLGIRRGDYRVVVGTRSAVFTPLEHLGLIIIEDEDADPHVQEDPSPRYDARRAAAVLTKLTGARLALISRYPSLASVRAINHSRRIDPVPRVTVTTVDLDRARAGRDYNLLAQPTVEVVRTTLETGGSVVVLHPRRSSFGSMACADCGHVLLCPSCRVPFHLEANQLYCLHCSQHAPVPTRCPHCQSLRLRGRGRGIEHVRSELNRLISDNKQTERIRVVTHVEEITLHAPADLGVVTRVETLLAAPRVDASERTRRTIIALAAHVRDGGRLLLQGAADTVREFGQLDPSSATYDREYAERERYGYPPAWRCLLLRHRRQSRSRDGITPDALTRRLRAVSGLSVNQPEPSPGRSAADRGGTRILIRYRRALAPPAVELIRKLDEAWSVSVDPLELR